MILLDLSLLRNTDFPIEKSPLNLVDVIHDAVRSGRQLGADKKLQITCSADKDIYMLNGDYGRLRQMLMIFLHNSIKFSPEGSEIKLELAGNRLKLIDHAAVLRKRIFRMPSTAFIRRAMSIIRAAAVWDWQSPSRLPSAMICSWSCRASWARGQRLLSVCRPS